MERTEHPIESCRHQWAYFVDVTTGMIGHRRCEICGKQMTLPSVNVGRSRKSAERVA